MTLPRLLIFTDRLQLPRATTLTSQIQRCVDAGATHVVLRELDLARSARARLVEKLSATGAVVLTAHERVIGAAGLHQPSSTQGAVLGLVGRSCHQRAEVGAAAIDGCAYATLGPFAPTASKPGYGPGLDPTHYGDLPISTYALGGIGASNAEAPREAGAFGIAVMGAVMRSTDPSALVSDLLWRIS